MKCQRREKRKMNAPTSKFQKLLEIGTYFLSAAFIISIFAIFAQSMSGMSTIAKKEKRNVASTELQMKTQKSSNKNSP